MLVLFETPAGFALFKVLDEGKLDKVEDLWKEFTTSDSARKKIDCLHNSAVMELMRGLRNQLTELVTGLGAQDLGPMSLGLSHSLSRYKLKFSPEKVDTMIIQAIGLLDDLDKELNTYAMRVRECCCRTEDRRIPALGIGGDGTAFPAPACSLTTPSRSRARQPSYLT
ncbi:probable nucleolar protein 5-1 isoform X3 [Miscanthus floridulus]